MATHHRCEKHRKLKKKHTKKRKSCHTLVDHGISINNSEKSDKKSNRKTHGKKKKCKKQDKKEDCMQQGYTPIIISNSHINITDHSISQEAPVEMPAMSPDFKKYQAQEYTLNKPRKTYSRPSDLNGQKTVVTPVKSPVVPNTTRAEGSSSTITNYSYAKFKYSSIDFAKHFGTAKDCFFYVYERPPLFYSVVTFFVCWWILSMIDSWYSEIMLNIVTYGTSIARWTVIWLEQTTKIVLKWATNAEELIESFYCDFAVSWCNRFEMLCDVKCSFLDKSLQRIRNQN